MGDAGVEDEISREELIVGAKKLKRCSDCLWENAGGDEDFESIAEVLRSEISHQVDFKAKYGSKVFQNDYIHARCEYFVKIATYLLEHNPQKFGGIAEVVIEFLHEIFNTYILYFQGSYNDGDNEHSRTAISHTQLPEASVIPSNKKESWHAICFTSTTNLLHAVIIMFPVHHALLHMTLSDAIALCKSELWQAQLIALSVLRSMVFLESRSVLNNDHGQNQNEAERENETLSALGRKRSSANFPSKSTAPAQNHSSSNSKKSTLRTSSSAARLSTTSSATSSKAELSSSLGKSAKQASTTMSRQSSQLRGEATNATATPLLPQLSEEICRIGFLRTLSWFMLHERYIIRRLAAQILLLVGAICTDRRLLETSPVVASAESPSRGGDCLSSMWPAFFEQGLIPFMETCAEGFHVNGSSSHATDAVKFPEAEIRHAAQTLLRLTVSHAERFHNIRQRILSALTYSGNAKLRMNLVSSICYLCARSSSLGPLLWVGPTSSIVNSTKGIHAQTANMDSVALAKNGQHFTVLCQGLLGDVSGAKHVLGLLIHLVAWARDLQNLSRCEDNSLLLQKQSQEIATQTVPNLSSSNYLVGTVAAQLKETLAPTVLIADISPKNGDSLKMACPKLTVIRKYSKNLADEIQKYHDLQVEEARHFYEQMHGENGDGLTAQGQRSSSVGYADSKTIERHLRTSMQGFGSQYYFTLEGAYNNWQDIFSHMCEPSLRAKMINKLSTSQLSECLLLAFQHSIDPLVTAYAESLSSRITSATILQILRTSLLDIPGIVSSSTASFKFNGYRLSLSLLHDCLEFLLREWEFCLRRKDARELQDIVQCLSSVFGIMANACSSLPTT